MHACSFDMAGYGILGPEVAPPTLPLFYYSEAILEDGCSISRQTLSDKEVYWYSYSQLKDKSMYSWAEHSLEADD